MNDHKIDAFAEIGAVGIYDPTALSPRPELPDLRLESNVSIESDYPAKIQKMSSKDQLNAKVASLKEHYAPFLRDLTPEPENRHLDDDSRIRITEAHFKYLKGLKLDVRQDLDDEIGWQNVTIPDPRGPEGKWAGVYKTTFRLGDAIPADKSAFIHFDSVDYRCEVYVNGVFVGRHVGLFSPFEFDITESVKPGENSLLVKIENDKTCLHASVGDKIYAATGLGWDNEGFGWVACPSAAGITGQVYIAVRSRVHLTDLFVVTDIETHRLNLWLEVNNTHLSPDPDMSKVPGSARDPERPQLDFRYRVYPKNFECEQAPWMEGDLPGGKAHTGKNTFKFALEINSDYRLWEPDAPCLYSLFIDAIDRQTSKVISSKRQDFGFRSFVSDEQAEPKGSLYFNGRRIYLRGTNTMGNLQWDFLRGDTEQLIEDILIAKAANLNFIRFTQLPVNPGIYGFLDMLGMGCQTDLPLFGHLSRAALNDALDQITEMERITRSHPCVWLESFMNEPWSDAQARKGDRLQKFLGTQELNQFLVIARDLVRIHNPHRVVKAIDGVVNCEYHLEQTVPYGFPDFHTYCMWYGPAHLPVNDLYAGDLCTVKPGWITSCGEYGTEGLDAVETMIHSRKWNLQYRFDWPPKSATDPDWSPRQIWACQHPFIHYHWFQTPKTPAEWVEKSHRHQAFATRLMTEAFRRRAEIMHATYVHLLIDAFPANWLKCLVSFDRTPKPAYFALADAMEPLAVNIKSDQSQFYGDRKINAEIWIFNDTPEVRPGCRLQYYLLDPDRKVVLFANGKNLDIPASGAFFQGRFVAAVPHAEQRRALEIHCALTDKDGKPIHDYTFPIEVFPSHRRELESLPPVGVIEDAVGTLAETLRQAGFPIADSIEHAKTLIVGSPTALENHRQLVLRHLEQGGTVLFWNQRCACQWRLDELEFRAGIIANPDRAESDFVGLDFLSKDTGHPAVAQFEENDFSYWHSPAKGRRDFLATHVIESQCDGQPILKSNATPVCCQYAVGRGRIIVNQVDLDGSRLGDHPVADRFLYNLLHH